METPEGFARRVRILAATYTVLFVASCAGVAVIALNGKLFVTLAQRSNVETLTVLFLLVLYAYFVAVSARGAWGAVRLVVYATRRRLARDALGERQRQISLLGSRIDRIAPALLEEALLPDWEYEAEHKLPVIPEPLGLVSLGRSASRADPVATMGFATVMVLLTLAVAVLFVLRPPWVPG